MDQLLGEPPEALIVHQVDVCRYPESTVPGIRFAVNEREPEPFGMLPGLGFLAPHGLYDTERSDNQGAIDLEQVLSLKNVRQGYRCLPQAHVQPQHRLGTGQAEIHCFGLIAMQHLPWSRS